MTKNAEKSIKAKKRFFHKYQKCRTSENWKNYTAQRNYVTKGPKIFKTST